MSSSKLYVKQFRSSLNQFSTFYKHLSNSSVLFSVITFLSFLWESTFMMIVLV